MSVRASTGDKLAVQPSVSIASLLYAIWLAVPVLFVLLGLTTGRLPAGDPWRLRH